MLNRCAIILRPKRPYLAWVETIQRTMSKGATIDPDEMRGDRTVYLIPSDDAEDSIDEVIAHIHADLFERELSEWYEDEALWPKSRTLKIFREWFDVEVCAMIVDLVPAPLVDDEAYEPESFWSGLLGRFRSR